MGGVSQKDIASINAVIDQLRIGLPDVEIILGTGAFGRTDPRDADALAKRRAPARARMDLPCGDSPSKGVARISTLSGRGRNTCVPPVYIRISSIGALFMPTKPANRCWRKSS
jgi:hypothetical protein